MPVSVILVSGAAEAFFKVIENPPTVCYNYQNITRDKGAVKRI